MDVHSIPTVNPETSTHRDMCIAELNRSTGSCGHTYFRLTRPCSSDTSLANCTKLSLSGWENRTETCAVCDPASTAGADPANYRLLGQYDELGGLGIALPRTNSLSTLTTTSLASARRDSRRGSLARSDSSNGSMASPGVGSPVPSAYPTPMAPMNMYQAEKNISQAQRVDAYLSQLPESITRRQSAPTVDENSMINRSRAGSKSSNGGGGGSGGGGEVSSDGDRSGVMIRWGQKGRKLTKSFF